MGGERLWKRTWQSVAQTEATAITDSISIAGVEIIAIGLLVPL